MTERKYGEATTVLFGLIDAGVTDFKDTPPTFASGDTQISKDEAAFGNTTNDPAHEGNGIYSLALTATEMEAARIAITIVDQTATKEWEDQGVIIETYGHASAQHEFDRNSDPRVKGAAVTGTLSTTQMSTDLTETTVDHWKGKTIIWRSGALQGQSSDITASSATGVLTYSTTTDAPANGDLFELY